MALEIERKFLVVGEAWRDGVRDLRRLRQAYLTKNGRVSIRIRIDGDETASLTIKAAAAGIARNEYEYSIPVEDALELFEQRVGEVVAKRRHLVPIGDVTWEIDLFEGENDGLVVAEIELPHAEATFHRPLWLGTEITHERRYYNADLARLPFKRW